MAGGRAGGGGFRFNVDDMRDRFGDGAGGGFGDLFGQMFGRGRDGTAPSGVGPRRGEDVHAALTMEFADAAFGITTTLHLTTDAQCSVCHGSGAKPGTSPKLCPACGGRGVVDDNQGLFSFSSPCRRCGGGGTIVEDPCPACRGSGTEKRDRQVQARIPAGVNDGQTIRLKGRGGPGFNGGPAGDLLVDIRVAPDEHFGRSGLDLTVRVEIDFWQAALGDVIGVPTLRGPDVTLRVRPGTQSGSRHRVKGKGIVTAKSAGDLIVTIDVAVPRHLTKEQRAAIEALRAASTVEREGATT
jgi:molecular chaperone DnaJ